jgi:GDP-4-dehydro-6-deoxy-D-mannose reductase
MRVLVTGARGFTGRRLVQRLKNDSSVAIFGADMTEAPEENCRACDLMDRESVSRMLRSIAPDQIYHLAGTFTNDYEADYRANVLTTKNLLDEIAASHPKCRILLVGSAAEYGAVQKSDNPVKETHPLRPVSVYGLTKVYQSHLMGLYCSLYGLDVVLARTFNLMGEDISERLFVGRLQKMMHDYKSGAETKIKVGSLSSRRDYIHVDQAVEDYAMVMRLGSAGEVYNVGSGKPIVIRELLRSMLLANGLDMSAVEEAPRPLTGKLDIEEIYADITKLEDLRNRS